MSEFVDYLQEVFEEFGPINSKKMFGGYGIYYQGVMFGLVADDTLYLKADDTISDYFTSRDLDQFEYNKSGKIVKMSYYQAPEEMLEDKEIAREWARRSFVVAIRSKKDK
jgi:DNA transformation protein